MRRRQFLNLVGGAAAWPLAARAQQREPMRRVGILMGSAAADLSEYRAHISAFLQELQKFGWVEGRNLHVDSLGRLEIPKTFSNTRPN